MKFLLVLFLLTPFVAISQVNEPTTKKRPPTVKLGPSPFYYADSVKLTKPQFMIFDVNTIASLTVLTDTDATNKFGLEAKDGVVLIETKEFARKHYIAYFRKRSRAFDSLYTATKSDSTFQYIINDKVKEQNSEGDLATINDDLFISLDLITADDLKRLFNIDSKSIGILIKCRKPQNLFNGDDKF